MADETAPAWVRIQKKTFTRWCNNYLTQRSLGINDLQTDLQDGVLLHNLLEILGNEDVLPKANKKAKLKLQKVENLNICLKYVKAKNIKLVGIGAEDLHDGNIKLILGLIWTLILRFQIMADDEESANARQALLDWCNSVLNPQGLYVKNFTHDWQDGRSFCGLVNAIEPNQIPLNTVPASEAEKNMNKAFTSAEQLFGFPQVLDAIDVIENPDDLSIMTYVSYFRAYMLANNAYGPNCTAEGPGLTEATTFEKAPFTITTYNEEGERVERGGAMVKAFLKDDSGAEVTKVLITDNRNGTYSAHYIAERPGKFTLEVLVKKDNIKNSPFHPTVKPGEPFPGNCEAHGPGISTAVSGVEVGFTVVTKDVSGNKIPRGGANISSVFHDAKGDIQVKIVDNNDGTYSATYTPKTAGTTRLDVTVATQYNGTGPIKNSPFSVGVAPGKADLNNFKWDGLELDAEGRRVVVAGTTDKFTVTARDGHSNRLTSGGLGVNGQISGPAPVESKTQDNNDGSYQLSYTPTKIGDYKFLVRVDNTPIGGHANPFPVLVIPAAAGGRSVASGPGLKNAEVGGSNNKFQVETRDDFDNKLTKGGSDVKADLVNDATGERVPVSVKDNGNGTYSAEYAPAKTGNYTLTPIVNGKPVVDAPFQVKVGAGGFDPNATTVEIPKPGHAGRKGPKVSVKDNQGNLRAGFEDDVEADLIPKIKISGLKARNNGDGTYEVDYPPTLLPGDYDVHVRVNGKAAPGAPFNAPVQLKALSPEEESALKSSVSGEALTVYHRLLLNATEAERATVLASLKK
jgi:filamin